MSQFNGGGDGFADRRGRHPNQVAHYFKLGQRANPRGAGAIPKDRRDLYREARRKALEVAPEMVERAIALARDSDDQRVASLNIWKLLEIAGIRPIDKPEEDERRPQFDASRATPEQLQQILAALRLMKELMAAPATTAPDERGQPIRGELIPPESESR
jgi:hypothetical protein